MIALFTTFYFIILYANRNDYFHQDDVLFYLNIFEINLAAVLMRWGENLADCFFEEDYYQ